MSSEQQHINKSATPDIQFADNVTPKITNRVDINQLLSRVREEKKKEKKESIVFLALVGSVILAVGVIASL